MRLRCIVAVLCCACVAQPAAQGRGNPTLTAVSGIKVGHYTYTERPTGCTVVLVRRRRDRRRLATRRRPWHPRNGPARSAEPGGQSQRGRPLGRQRVRARRRHRRGEVARGASHRLVCWNGQSARSSRPPSCSTSASAARCRVPTPTAAIGRREPPASRRPLKETSARERARRSANWAAPVDR